MLRAGLVRCGRRKTAYGGLAAGSSNPADLQGLKPLQGPRLLTGGGHPLQPLPQPCRVFSDTPVSAAWAACIAPAPWGSAVSKLCGCSDAKGRHPWGSSPVCSAFGRSHCTAACNARRTIMAAVASSDGCSAPGLAQEVGSSGSSEGGGGVTGSGAGVTGSAALSLGQEAGEAGASGSGAPSLGQQAATSGKISEGSGGGGAAGSGGTSLGQEAQGVKASGDGTPSPDRAADGTGAREVSTSSDGRPTAAPAPGGGFGGLLWSPVPDIPAGGAVFGAKPSRAAPISPLPLDEGRAEANALHAMLHETNDGPELVLQRFQLARARQVWGRA